MPNVEPLSINVTANRPSDIRLQQVYRPPTISNGPITSSHPVTSPTSGRLSLDPTDPSQGLNDRRGALGLSARGESIFSGLPEWSIANRHRVAVRSMDVKTFYGESTLREYAILIFIFFVQMSPMYMLQTFSHQISFANGNVLFVVFVISA